MPAIPAPSGISLGKGSAFGGDAVTVSGHYMQAVDRVTVGGVEAEFVLDKDGNVVLKTPAHTAGNAEILLWNGSDSVSAGEFTFLQYYIASEGNIGLAVLANSLRAGETLDFTARRHAGYK